ncbi:hypothetical protein Tco_0206299 [Tanacetum coccineum]
MCIYLKNMSEWKPKDLKTKSFANVQELFDKAMKRVNTFIDMDIEIKKQKIDDDQEEAENKKLMEVVLDEEKVAADAIPLATKPPSIVDWKIVKEGKMSFFQIIKANRSVKITLYVVSKSTYLYVGREAVSTYTSNNYRDAEQKAAR